MAEQSPPKPEMKFEELLRLANRTRRWLMATCEIGQVQIDRNLNIFGAKLNPSLFDQESDCKNLREIFHEEGLAEYFNTLFQIHTESIDLPDEVDGWTVRFPDESNELPPLGQWRQEPPGCFRPGSDGIGVESLLTNLDQFLVSPIEFLRPDEDYQIEYTAIAPAQPVDLSVILGHNLFKLHNTKANFQVEDHGCFFSFGGYENTFTGLMRRHMAVARGTRCPIPGARHHCKIEKLGGRFRFFVDGSRAYEYIDAIPPTTSGNGWIHLYTYAPGTRFLDLTVRTRPTDLASMAPLRLDRLRRAIFKAKRNDYSYFECHLAETSVDPNPERTRFHLLLKDVSQVVRERKAAEEQLRQAQKLEAVGQLAGGIAHEFNNLLLVINGFTKMVADKLGPAHPSNGFLQKVLAAGDRASSLTGQLLSFSRRQVLKFEDLDLNTVAFNFIQLFERLIGEQVTVQFRPCAKPCWVHADAGQLEQILLNLSLNARDAMPLGGTLTISVSQVEIGPASPKAALFPRQGPHVCLQVRDTGTGILPQFQHKIFEPFFSTKEVGQGSGLGLSMVQGSVSQHGGAVYAESQPGEGSVFKIFLPAIPPKAPTPEHAPEAAATGGDETILIVDDEDAVRSFLTQSLEQFGYRVHAAADGLQALEILEQKKAEIDLVILDLMMPRLNGAQTQTRMKLLKPGLPILFMTGYSPKAMLESLGMEHPVQILKKPYRVNELACKVRELLDTACARR